MGWLKDCYAARIKLSVWDDNRCSIKFPQIIQTLLVENMVFNPIKIRKGLLIQTIFINMHHEIKNIEREKGCELIQRFILREIMFITDVIDYGLGSKGAYIW